VKSAIQCRLSQDIDRVCALVREVFNEFVAPCYSEESQKTFCNYAAPDAMRQRIGNSHVTFIAERFGGLLGMLHFQQPEHVAMLFVRREQQRHGVGRALLRSAQQYALQSNPSDRTLTVNASPNAVPAYLQMGFRPVGKEQLPHGIRFVPMRYDFGLV
jgi:GNAT superfamily N-acetyltransferase